MKNTINKKINALCHYLLIYLVIACGGTSWTSFIGNDNFVIITCLLPIFYLVLYKRIQISKDFTIMILLFSIFTLLAMVYSSLSIGTYLNVLGKILLAYMVIDYNRSKFLERFIKLSIILCSVSLILYFITQIVGFTNVFPFYSRLYTNLSDGSYALGNGYGLLIYRWIPLHANRNCGMFTEPGEYAIFTNVVLYFLLFKADYLDNRKRVRFIIIIVLTILTIQSTSGYGMFAAILILYSLGERDNLKLKLMLFPRLLIGSIIGFRYIQELYTSTVTDKIIVNGMITLNHGTASARSSSISSVIEYVSKHPMSVFGIGFEKLQAEGIGSCAGLLAVFLAVGIFAFSIFYGYIISITIRNRKNWTDVGGQLAVILIAGLSQPGTLFPVILLMSFLSLFYCMRGQKYAVHI